MEIKTKFSVGQEVVLFNSASQRIEHDQVFGILISPNPVPGKELHVDKSVAEQLEEGSVVVSPKYQLQMHQGLLDECILFPDEASCAEFYRNFFAAE